MITGRDGGTVLVTSRSFSSGERNLEGDLTDAGYRVVRASPRHELESLAPALSTAVAWIAGTGPVTAQHLAQAGRLKVVARYGVGVEAVDLAAARQRGVVVTNTPGANSDSVADHALGLLLASIRGVTAGDRAVRAGLWTATRGRELSGLTVGLAGNGRIGQAVLRRLLAFGATVLVHDPYVADEVVRAQHAAPVGLQELAQRCDAVSLHAPGGQQIVNAAWLARAAKPMTIVNTARADLVDEEAVAAGLRSGVVAGYAADTLQAESGNRSPLLAGDLADRVVVTPHVAATTTEAIDRMGSMAVQDVLAVLGRQAPAHPVL